MTSKQRSALILAIFFFIFLIGVAIPKLAIRDLVPVDKEFRKNVLQAVWVHCDNPFERLALLLGKSRIVRVTRLSAEVESFTLFGIPAGFLYGTPDMRVLIDFNQDDDWSAKSIQTR